MGKKEHGNWACGIIVEKLANHPSSIGANPKANSCVVKQVRKFFTAAPGNMQGYKQGWNNHQHSRNFHELKFIAYTPTGIFNQPQGDVQVFILTYILKHAVLLHWG